MNKLWTSAALVPCISLLAILSACGGSSPEETTGDLDEYCASVDHAEDICDEVEASAEPSTPAKSAEQTGDDNFNPFAYKPGFRMTL